MTRASKRFAIAGALAFVVLVIVGLMLTPSGNRGYRAESLVITKSYTNVLLASTFEAEIMRTTSTILRLRVTPRFMPGSGTQVITNGVSIRIFATGITSEDAQHAANQAAAQVCQTVLTNYGINGLIAQRANSARSYSYFQDGIKPAISRMFQR